MVRPRDLELVLVDFDDTLVDTAPRFATARRDLFALLAGLGFDPERVERVHHDEVDPVVRRRYGFGPHRMPDAFHQTYLALCAAEGWVARPDVIERCRTLGDAVAGTPPAIEGALDALRRLARALPAAVYTQAGDPDYQLGCLRDAGVLDAVGQDRVRVVPVKNAETLALTLEDLGVHRPERACMVGNSIRSDINPALEVGARAILVEIDDPWHHDQVQPLHLDFPRVPRFADAVDLLLSPPAPD